MKAVSVCGGGGHMSKNIALVKDGWTDRKIRKLTD